MYQIFYKGECLYDPRNKSYTLLYPVAHLTYGEAGTLTFTIDNNHPKVNTIEKMRGIVELISDGATVWSGRILRDTKDFDNARVIECEGIMSVLNDTVIPPHTFPDDWLNDAEYQAAAATGNVVQFYLSWLVGQHNAQVAADHKLTLGTVDVEDSSNYIERETAKYQNTFEVIRQNLTETVLGGYLNIRYANGATYLDYKKGFYADTVRQDVMFGKNMLDVESEVDGSELYSIVVPIGKDGLTIDALPDGAITSDISKHGVSVVKGSLETQFGSITKIIEYSDEEDEEALQQKAVDALESIGLATSITCKACDLHYVDSSVPPFRIGHMVSIKDEPHALTYELPITEIEINLVDPAETVVTLGEKSLSLGDINKKKDYIIPEGIPGAPGAPGERGEQGYSLVASVDRSSSFTQAQWETYGTIGHVEEWGNTASIRNGCRVGDLFTVQGTATDTGRAYILTYRSQTASGNLSGVCIAKNYTDRGATGVRGSSVAVAFNLSNKTDAEWEALIVPYDTHTWSGTASIRGNCAVNDLFCVTGTSTDGKNAYMLNVRCTNNSGDLAGKKRVVLCRVSRRAGRARRPRITGDAGRTRKPRRKRRPRKPR